MDHVLQATSVLLEQVTTLQILVPLVHTQIKLAQ